MISDELHKEIVDEIVLGDDSDWKISKPRYDLSKCAHTDIKIFPDTAQTIDEIERFEFSNDVMGCVNYTYKRK